jgi:hypothetical protein
VFVTKGRAATRAAQEATAAIPVVMAPVDDPYEFVASLSRPTGNITGLALQQTELRTELCTLPTYTSAQRWTTPSRACLFVTLLQNFPVSRQATVVLLQHSKNFETAPHCRANWLLGCYRLANSGGLS